MKIKEYKDFTIAKLDSILEDLEHGSEKKPIIANVHCITNNLVSLHSMKPCDNPKCKSCLQYKTYLNKYK